MKKQYKYPGNPLAHPAVKAAYFAKPSPETGRDYGRRYLTSMIAAEPEKKSLVDAVYRAGQWAIAFLMVGLLIFAVGANWGMNHPQYKVWAGAEHLQLKAGQ